MKISVVTACFNSAETLGDTLRSVALQTHPDVEHIIVDGGSVDNTTDLVRRKEFRVARLISERDAGVYDAMNKGIAASTGEVIGFLNGDDWYASDHVLAHIAEAFEDPQLEGVYADLDYVDRADPARITRKWRSQEFRPGLFKQGWMPAHPTFYVRQEVFQRLGGFDLAFPRQADFELALRFMEINRIRTRYVQEVWVKMRTGGISNASVRGILKGNIEAYQACRKNGLAVGPWFIPVKMASRIPQFMRAARSFRPTVPEK